MKVFVDVSVFILVLFAPSLSEVIIQEDFTNPTFPPAGWSTSSTGVGGSWNWTNYGQSGNGYAHGQVILASYQSQGTTTLITNNFSANWGDTIRVLFDRRNDCISTMPAVYMFSMYVCNGNGDFCGQLYSPNSTWTHVDYSHTVYSDSDHWNIKWKIIGELYHNNLTTIYFDIDNVLIEKCGVGVESTSLGNIKASFH